MSKIHYFQRYSSVENTVTNNTLQLLARIYDHSPAKASVFLSRLVDEDDPIDIGIEINQQQHGAGSVPDGAVIQRSFKILIESKVDSPVNVDQLLRHADDFTTESRKVLLLLTKGHIGPIEADIRARLDAQHPDVVFRNVTYEEIIAAVDGLFLEHETVMRDLAQDYAEYCRDVNLIDQSRFLLRIVPCGLSLDINRRYGVYFHPSDRGYSDHRFLGIYKNKAVHAIWEVDSVFDVELRGDVLSKTRVMGRDTDEYDTNIVGIIKDALTECGYEIATGHRFFCGKPIDTYFRKSSSGGIMGARFIDLRDVIGDFHSAGEVAEKLNGKEWY